MARRGSNFANLEKKLEAKGMSKAEAGGTAYKIGVKKYGRRGMKKKAAAGRTRMRALKPHGFKRARVRKPRR